jgi:DNA-binding CsgD family transcriptional regulator
MVFINSSDLEIKLINQLKANISGVIQFGSDHLGYRYFLADGSSFGLTTNPMWYKIEKTQAFYEKQREHFESELLYLINKGLSYVTRSTYQFENDYLVELNHRDMANSVGIYKFSQQKIEHFFFISKSKEHSRKDLMLNNLDNLEQAAKKIATLMNDAINNLEAIPQPEFYLSKSIINTIFSKVKTGHNKNFKIYMDDKEIRLTQRELEILSLLKHNYSNRVLAQHLGISIRTIDWYINNLKEKFNCNRDKLIKISDSPQLKHLIKNKVA